MLMTNVKRRRPKGIVLLVIGSIIIVFFGSSLYLVGGGQSPEWATVFTFPTIVGVLIFVIALVRLLVSRKKYSKPPDKSVT